MPNSLFRKASFAIVFLVCFAHTAFAQIDASVKLASQPPAASDDVAQVMVLEHQIEDAVVRGDVAFFDRVTPADFSFVHGDQWIKGGKPLASDDK
jgi:hypothetical protein